MIHATICTVMLPGILQCSKDLNLVLIIQYVHTKHNVVSHDI